MKSAPRWGSSTKKVDSNPIVWVIIDKATIVVAVELPMRYGGRPTGAFLLRLSITIYYLASGVCRLYNFLSVSSSHVLAIIPSGKDSIVARASRVIDMTSLVASLDITTLFSYEYPWAHHETISG